MMKNIIRDVRGFSHEVVAVLLVVIVGIGGSAYLVLSHADDCPPASGATSIAQSSPVSGCTTVSGATSQPVSTVAAAGSCYITVSPSTRPGYRTIPTFNIVVTNTGSGALKPLLTAQLSTYGQGKNYNVVNTSALGYKLMGQRSIGRIVYAPKWKVPYANTKTGMTGAFVTAVSKNPAYQCRVDFTLPTQSHLKKPLY